jgi:hypothetical protein
MIVRLLHGGSLVVTLLATCHVAVAVQKQAARPARPPTAYARALQFVDLNNDRKVEPAELAAAQQSAAMILALDWTEADTDGDGTLSAAEFMQAAAKTLQALLADKYEAEDASEQQAHEDLASAVPFSLILERLAERPRYADEVAALHRALDDTSGDEELVACIAAHPASYPHLTPVLQTWIHSYPVRPGLLRYLTPSRPAAEKPPLPGGRAGQELDRRQPGPAPRAVPTKERDSGSR